MHNNAVLRHYVVETFVVANGDIVELQTITAVPAVYPAHAQAQQAHAAFLAHAPLDNVAANMDGVALQSNIVALVANKGAPPQDLQHHHPHPRPRPPQQAILPQLHQDRGQEVQLRLFISILELTGAIPALPLSL